MRAIGRQPLTLDYGRGNVDRLLAFSDRPILQGAGKLSHDAMKMVAYDRFEAFDTQRRAFEASAADAEDLKTLEAVEIQLQRSAVKGDKK